MVKQGCAMNVFCPQCAGQAVLLENSQACARCSTPLAMGGRYVLVSAPSGGQAVDEVDGAMPIRPGHDVTTHTDVAIRLAPTDAAARVEREATVLRGLRVPEVPRVLDLLALPGVGTALIMELPRGETLETQLAHGLRTDGKGARLLLAGMLRLLVRLHALSPPVFHRNLHPGSVFWDGQLGVRLWDFARATDTVDDQQADLVMARPGYHPTTHKPANPAQAELYGVGATLVALLTRRGVDTLKVVDGMPDFRPHVRLDGALEDFLERLLAAGTRRAFVSAAAALEALENLDPRPTPFRLAPWLAVGVPLLVLTSGTVTWTMVSKPTTNVVVQPPRPPRPPPPTPPVNPPPTPPQPPVPPAVQPNLQVTSEPSGAEVFLDGQRVGRTPLVEMFRVGADVAVEARLQGYTTEKRTVSIQRDTVMHLQLRPLPVKPTAPPVEVVPVVPRVDDRLVKELLARITARKDALEACNTDNSDRVRLRVELNPQGAVERVEPMGRAQLASTQCVAAEVKKVSLEKLGANQSLSVDIWVYLRPQFKVAVY
jgi:hypothetical protein